MPSTEIAKSELPVGRSSSEVLNALRAEIDSGKYSPGQFLPTERQLATQYAVAQNTVRRALKALAAERLVVAEARQGYRVLAKVNNPDRGCPLVFVNHSSSSTGNWMDVHAELHSQLKHAADARGWPLLAMVAGQLRPEEIVERLGLSRAFAAAVSVKDEAIVRAIQRTGVPVLMLDERIEGLAGVDSIMQDGHQGGRLAAQYLLGKGCRKIVWLGQVDENMHTLTRFGGASATLALAGRPLTRDQIQAAAVGEELAAARKLLTRKDRPDGIIALWLGQVLAVAKAADELGLKQGVDFHVVGWCREDNYERDFLPAFKGAPPPPAVVWSASTMARVAVARLAERRDNPDLPALQVCVPVRLRLD